MHCGPANVISAAEIHGSPFYVDDVATEPLQLEGGSLAVPDAPGLGVTVDEAKLADYRIDF